MKNPTAIVQRGVQQDQHPTRSPQRSPQPEQDYPLRIELLPDALQWWSELRYWLIHEASGLRVPGSFNEEEAFHIQKVTWYWDWTIDTRDRKVACGVNLLALAELVCQRSPQDEGAK